MLTSPSSSSVNSVVRLKNCLESILAENPPAAALADKLQFILAQVLSAKISRPQIIATLCAALERPLEDKWLKVAAAFELLLPAYDIIDDVQDGKFAESSIRAEMGQWLNLALYLLHTALNILDSSDFEPAALVKVRRSLHNLVLEAVKGQVADLETEETKTLDGLDTQVALEMSRLKSGSFVQLIYETVGTLADLSNENLTRLSTVGQLTGTAWQLQNDLRDIYFHPEMSETAVKNSDIGRYKKTVPLVFALNFARQYPSPAHQILLDYYERKLTGLNCARLEQLCALVQASGAVAYTEAVIEMHRVAVANLVAELKENGYPQAAKLLAIFNKKTSEV